MRRKLVASCFVVDHFTIRIQTDCYPFFSVFLRAESISRVWVETETTLDYGRRRLKYILSREKVEHGRRSRLDSKDTEWRNRQKKEKEMGKRQMLRIKKALCEQK